MITLITKSEHKLPLPLLRISVVTKAYLVVEEITLTKRGARTKGHYYCYHEGGKHWLSDINNKIIPKEQIFALETQLKDPTSTHLFDIATQRIKELTMVQLQEEGLENYEIPPSDWEVLKEA